jgi:hypothetical protein
MCKMIISGKQTTHLINEYIRSGLDKFVPSPAVIDDREWDGAAIQWVCFDIIFIKC